MIIYVVIVVCYVVVVVVIYRRMSERNTLNVRSEWKTLIVFVVSYFS